MYKPGKILDRYIIRNMLFSYVVVFAVFVGLRIVVDLFTQIDEFTERMLPAKQVVKNILVYYGYHLFQYYQEFAGPIVVFAALFTLFRIKRSRETVALLSSGISLYRLLWPVMLVGILLNGLLIVNQELIIPSIADKLVRKQENAVGDLLVNVNLQADRNNALLLGKLNVLKENVTDCWLVERDGQGSLTRLRRARTATWDADQGGWLMTNVRSLTLGQSQRGHLGWQKSLFYETDLSPKELSLRAGGEYLRYQPTSRLLQMSMQEYLRKRMGMELEVEKHFRFTGSLANVIILLLAAPLVTSREPRTVFLHMIKGLLAVVGAFTVAFVCQQLAGQHIAPLIAAWLPILIFGPAAVLVLDSIKT